MKINVIKIRQPIYDEDIWINQIHCESQLKMNKQKKKLLHLFEKKKTKKKHCISFENNLKLKDRLVSIACEWISEFSLRFWAYISSCYHDLINKLYTKKNECTKQKCPHFCECVNYWTFDVKWIGIWITLHFTTRSGIVQSFHTNPPNNKFKKKMKWNEKQSPINFVCCLLARLSIFFSV